MKIQEAATKIISMWEHGGRYDSHGNGAYGLIGWEGGQLTNLLGRYLQMGGSLAYSPAHYVKTMSSRPHSVAELNAKADDELMQECQRQAAFDYMTKAIKYQQAVYPFSTALSQLVLCDMGVNNGLWNNYVKHCGFQAGDYEREVIIKAQKYRIQAVKDAGQWDKYEGIRRRYSWYLDVLKTHGTLDMAPMQPSVMVNGKKVVLGLDAIVPVSL